MTLKNKLEIILSIVLFLTLFVSCSQDSPTENILDDKVAQITFIEIGSVSCVPCQQMQPVMISLEERYGEEQLEVLFIDIIQDPAAAAPYKIRLMPTQVFLDEKGVEFHRHEGFYPENEIDSVLQARGLKPTR